MNRLIEIGFQCVGHWKLDKDYPICELTNQINTKNILYVFVSNGEVKYIGKTTQPLKKRMYGYQNPSPTQSTNIKNNKNIQELLKAGEAVDIFVLADNGLLRYGGFHINLAAGLEDSLISDLLPSWNGKKQTINATDEKPKKLTSFELAKAIETSSGNITFDFQVRPTYFNQGFFNVPVKYMHDFGSDRDKIEMYCGENQDLVQGYINRSVNVNNTPRIMGGVKLRQWFQENFQVNNPITVELFSSTSIWLR